MGSQSPKAPDEEEGSQGSPPGRGDSNTYKGSRKCPGNPRDWCVRCSEYRILMVGAEGSPAEGLFAE